MWASDGLSITMAVGDFGIKLPVTLSDITITSADEFRIRITKGGAAVVELTFSDIENNTFDIELTREQSDKLRVGNYLYSLDWYQNGHFMCNVIPAASFKVVAKV